MGVERKCGRKGKIVVAMQPGELKARRSLCLSRKPVVPGNAARVEQEYGLQYRQA